MTLILRFLLRDRRRPGGRPLPLWGPLVLILIAALETGDEMYEWVRRVWKESAE